MTSYKYRIPEAYRPDLLQHAIDEGKSRHSARAKACQCIEDQQVQILEDVCIDQDLIVGDVIYDALLLERREDDSITDISQPGRT